MHGAKDQQSLTNGHIVVKNLCLFVGLACEHQQRLHIERLNLSLASGLPRRGQPIVVFVE